MAAVTHGSWSWADYGPDLGAGGWRYLPLPLHQASHQLLRAVRCREEFSRKVLCSPISKQRNKHIQRVLVEAAKLAPRESPELAMIRARELERGNPNRATLAVARKMVCYMLAVERRQQDFVPAGESIPTAAA